MSRRDELEHIGGEWCLCDDCDPMGKLSGAADRRADARRDARNAAELARVDRHWRAVVEDAGALLAVAALGYGLMYGLAVAASRGVL